MRIFFFICLLMSVQIMKSVAQDTHDIQGHRGCRGLLPENSIVGFIEAVNLGVNTIELDVVVSKDHKIVVSHDPYFNPDICSMPNGEPFSAANKDKYRIYELTYEQIREFDCGKRGHPGFPQQKAVSVYKPLLSAVIDEIEDYIQRNQLPPVKYNIEIKSTPGGDDIAHPNPYVFSNLLYQLIRQKGIQHKCNVQSFDPRPLQEFRKLDSTVVLALLVLDADGLRKNLKQLGFTPEIYSPHFLLVNKRLIKACHEKNMLVIPWTVNEEKKMRKLKSLGTDGVITDYPDVAVKVLRRE